MCGIAGQFETRLMRPPEAGVLEAMAGALAHRGPDDQGVHCGEHWGLANRRLSIIGVETGHQPLSNEDGTVWVTFNGEIYNHRALRAGLLGAGHVFSGTSDTEVLVHLYEDMGEGLVTRLEGMFAFALVDVPGRRLLLGRDRLGQKPLLYTVTREGTLAFASEMSALLAVLQPRPEIDLQALLDYLALGYIPAPRTIYGSIRKLPPGSILSVSFRADQAEMSRYWRPTFEPKERLRPREAVARTRELLEEAVRKRLESEVPLGAFLSGGLDSGLVVATMQRGLDVPARTFTMGFQEPRYDERGKAEALARHLGTRHASDVADTRDAALLEDIVRHCGEPFCDASILPTALLSRFTRGGVTVALSGDGGDELFGGYERYRVMAVHRSLSFLPLAGREVFCRALLSVLPRNRAQRTPLATVRRLLGAFGAPPLAAYMGFQGIFSPEALEALRAGPLSEAGLVHRLEGWRELLREGTAAEPLERFLELDMVEYLPGDLLTKVDIASMMFSLEVRSPFLDHELVDFVTRLPVSLKVGPRYRKRILAEIAREVLPPAVATQPKRGFGVPIAEWLRGGLSDQVREMVLWQQEWDTQGFFNNQVLRQLAEDHLNGYRDCGAQLWAVFCFKLWLEHVHRGEG
ncbi:MAG: asparagine synthase (glutamine-hydrolyzing) [Lentisphaeria bacterium]|nr:asparagine synthase (glutamine-hydrolyzing) [Lentisphaeria bacterium]